MRRPVAAGLVAAFALALLAPAVALAAGPPNDDFAAAIVISSSPDGVNIDLTAATAEPGEPSPCTWDPAPRTVWYALDLPEGGMASIVPLGFGPGLAVYSASAADVSSLTPITSTTWSSLQFEVEAGAQYYLQVSSCGWSSNYFAVRLSFTPPAPNDDIIAATRITAVPASDTVDMAGATLEPGEETPCVSMTARTVWYAYTPDADGVLVVSTARSTAWYLVVNVYSSAGPASAYGALTLAVCGNYGRTPIPVRAGTTYYVQVAEYGTPGIGVLNIDIDFAVPPPNDDFEDAVAAIGPTFTTTVDTRAATREPGEPPMGTDRTAWYVFDARVGGSASIDPAGSFPPDVMLNLYRATGDGFGGLVYVKASWGTPLTWTAPAGARYYIQVTDWGGGGGKVRLAFSLPADTTPPVPVIAGVSGPYAVDASIAFDASATDLVDPSPSLACSIAGPSGTRAVECVGPVDAWTLGPGSHTLSITATDSAGNEATATVAFGVVATYASVSNLTTAWSSKAAVVRDLVAILRSAEAAEARGQVVAEANKLAEYRAGVRAQSGKAFPADMALLLIAFSYEL